MSSTSPAAKTSPVPARIPASCQVGSRAPTASARKTPAATPAAMADPAERRRRAVVPALAARLGHEPRSDCRGAQQGPQGERRDWECGDRDDRVHAARRVAANPARSRAQARVTRRRCRCRGRAGRRASSAGRGRGAPRGRRVGEPAAVERQAAAADALGQPGLSARARRSARRSARSSRSRAATSRAASGARSGGSFASSAPISSSVRPTRWAKTMNAIRRSTGRG